MIWRFMRRAENLIVVVGCRSRQDAFAHQIRRTDLSPSLFDVLFIVTRGHRASTYIFHFYNPISSCGADKDVRSSLVDSCW